MLIPRIYRRNPPTAKSWSELETFNARDVMEELADEVESVRTLAGLTTDWTAITAPPDSDPMMTAGGAPVEGWPSPRYFARAIHYMAKQLEEGAATSRIVGGSTLYVWESPDTWTTEDPDMWSTPEAFAAMFDPDVADGFGSNFSLFVKWKRTIEAMRATCDSLLVMFNNVGTVTPNYSSGVIHTQTPQYYSEPFTFRKYAPLALRQGVYNGSYRWRTFTPTPYANSITEQYFCTNGGPTPAQAQSVPLRRETFPGGSMLTAEITCGSVAGNVSANFRTAWYDPGNLSQESVSATSVLSVGAAPPFPVVCSTKTGKRTPTNVEFSHRYEVGQAVSYPQYVYPTVPSEDLGNMRAIIHSMGWKFSADADADFNAARLAAKRTIGARAVETATVSYTTAPNANRDFSLQFQYPVTFSRDPAASETAALTATVQYVIDGNSFTTSVAPNENKTVNHTLYISDDEITITVTVTNADAIITAAAALWKVNASNMLSYKMKTQYYVDTGETIRVGPELIAVLADGGSDDGDELVWMNDEPLAVGYLRTAYNKV